MVRDHAAAATKEYLAECLWPGVTEDALAEADERARESARTASVDYLGSMLMPEDEVVFFVFRGPSAGAVRTVAASAQIPFERIVESVRRPARASERRSDART